MGKNGAMNCIHQNSVKSHITYLVGLGGRVGLVGGLGGSLGFVVVVGGGFVVGGWGLKTGRGGSWVVGRVGRRDQVPVTRAGGWVGRSLLLSLGMGLWILTGLDVIRDDDAVADGGFGVVAVVVVVGLAGNSRLEFLEMTPGTMT